VIVTVSAGITIFPSDDTEIDNLLRNADIAMTRAKKQGRNQYRFYTADMNIRGAERLAMERNLRKALEQHEYRLYYQPKVESTTGRMLGMEALLRWEHPERGIVAPGEFIPILEDSSLIIPVGEWVLRKACEANKAWQDAGFAPLRVAVNVSAHQFKQPGFVGMVRKILGDTGLESRYLELELTESVLMEDAQTSIATLDELKRMGIHIAMDDFGTGYSSLSYLKRIPIDTLKIDRSFIHNLSTSSDNAAIVTAIMALAHSLRLNVVAEGVEEAKELMFLSALGCHVIQGFYFSKPLPADEFTKLQGDSTRFISMLESLRTA
jgi:EAL domain-containing protein (putative c-di-GMP-specific phosphodiesterase class I)